MVPGRHTRFPVHSRSRSQVVGSPAGERAEPVTAQIPPTQARFYGELQGADALQASAGRFPGVAVDWSHRPSTPHCQLHGGEYPNRTWLAKPTVGAFGSLLWSSSGVDREFPGHTAA
jgi:hypothetical protein